MHDRLILGIAVVIGLGFLLAMALAKAAGRRSARFDASIRQTPEPVGRALWAPNAPLWENSSTPIYDQLSAENLRAELDDDDALARWLGASS